MPNSGLTGSRIRQTRLSRGLRQAELAGIVGISASYLNLIEHNRRRIGGKLLVDISRELQVDAALLRQGAQTELLEALDSAASGQSGVATEHASSVEFAGRFPGWAGLIAAQHARIEDLERMVEALTDRMTHDPQLAASMHEMLSVVTAIRSTAAILTDGSHLDPEWQLRFQRNLDEDSRRLAQNAQALVSYLDATDEGQTAAQPTLPKEELEHWLAARSFHVAELEGEQPMPVAALLEQEPQLTGSATTAAFASDWLQRYRRDALAVPLDELMPKIGDPDCNPLQFSQKIGTDMATVLRRMASGAPDESTKTGLVSCDSSGTLTFCKPIDGFALPRFGAACPLWPLYQALARPMTPLRTVVEQAGQQRARYVTYAIAQPVSEPEFASEPLYEATMLILPDTDGNAPASPVGSSCRICARDSCRGRREPSILTAGF